MNHKSVILSEVFVREQRTKTQSKDPYPAWIALAVERRSYCEQRLRKARSS